MLVVIDANVIVKDALLRERKWQVAQSAIRADRLRLILPEIARREAIGGYRRAHEEKIQQVKTVIRKSTNRAKQAAKALLDVYVDEMDGYEALLDARLRDVGFEVPDPPQRNHLELTDRAVNRVPPFDDNGGGYRDTLVWMTALEQIEEPPFDHLILVSDDAIFTKRIRDLAEELHRETGAQLLVHRSITTVEFPGEYESGSYDLSTLDIDASEIAKRIKDSLPGTNISRWSPPGVDHAQVERVDQIDLLVASITVKKRYGIGVYEVTAEAVADIDAEVLVIRDGPDDDVDFSHMSARWDLRVRWHGETQGDRTHLSDQDSVEVLGLDDRRRPLH